MSGKVMIIGLGDVGGHALELLARTAGITKVFAADINEQVGLRQVYSARAGAAHLGFYPNIEFIRLDLNDIENTTRTLADIEPDIIMHNATLMNNLQWARLPREVTERLASAGIANIVPCHLTLTYKLMKAVQRSEIDAHVVMSPYPDVVNAVLGKVGFARNLVGLGNIDYIVPGIQKAAADKLGVDMRSVSVFLVAPYAVLNQIFRHGTPGDLPYYLKILIGDKDVSERLNVSLLLSEAAKHLSLFTIHDLGFIAASSGTKNALAILNDAGLLTHAPGPCGLLGGYPVKLSAKGADVVLPDGLTLQEAVRINEEAIRKGDGVEKIKDDGTIVFTEKCAKTWREVLGYDCQELKVEDCEERAKELLSLHKQHL